MGMAPNPSSTINLSPQLFAYLRDLVDNGAYADIDTAVEELLLSSRGGSEDNLAKIQNWPYAGGECGALIREKDWAGTSVGRTCEWSPELRATVANVVNSPVAKVLMWGPDHVMFYNDAYSPIIGHRHPTALGQPVATELPEVWDWNRPILEKALAGEIISHKGVPITLENASGSQSFTFDLHYTPVYGFDGHIQGVMCTVVDQTAQAFMQRNIAISVGRFR